MSSRVDKLPATGDCDWFLLFPSDTETSADHELFAAHCPELLHPAHLIKSDHRSRVGITEIEGRKLVVKRFMLQENWVWFKWTSIWFPSLAASAFKNAIAMNNDGIATPLPILHIARKDGRKTTGGCLVYPFVEGRPATVDDAPLIVNFIRRMHDANWISRDPHPDNYIVTPDGLVALDPLRARRSRNPYLKAYDVMLLEHDIHRARELYGVERLGFWFPMAKFGHQLVRLYRSAKQTLRKLLGLKKHSGS